VMMVVAAVLAGGIVYGANWHYSKQADEIAVKMTDADREAKNLAEVKKAYETEKRDADDYEKRVKVIEQLRTNQSGPVNLLNMIGDTVNSTDAVWLDTVDDTGSSVNIDGEALTTTAVANLITNLKRTGYFKTVEIKTAAEDPSKKDVQTFNFTLICEKQKS
jgi:Tfp pilus assembly protein PilN